MNLVFPMALYTSVYLEDKEFLPPTVGVVFPGKPADGKLFPGDTITAVDGESVASFPDVQKAFAKRAGVPMRVQVDRDGKPVDVTVTPADETEVVEPSELELYEHVGRIGIAPTYAAPVIGVSRTDSPAFRAGLRTFDRITAVNGRKVETFVELSRVLSQNRGDNVVLTYVRPVSVPRSLGGLCDIAVLETGIASLSPRPRAEGAAARDDDPDWRSKDMLDSHGHRERRDVRRVRARGLERMARRASAPAIASRTSTASRSACGRSIAGAVTRSTTRRWWGSSSASRTACTSSCGRATASA